MHINDLRTLGFEQLKALRSASADDLDAEIKRAKAFTETAQMLVNSAKVEVDYLAATDQGTSVFLQTLGQDNNPGTKVLPGPGNGITSITQHRIGR
jgi:hypothetical protein